MSDEKAAALERIRKLLRMTKANGCTEAEAMAAAQKAARLMQEWRVSVGDVEFASERVRARYGANSVRAGLWATIAACTNTASILVDDEVEYVGCAPWPDVARYLHQVTDRAVDRELKAFQSGAWYRRRSSIRAKRAASHDFVDVMVHRLRHKLAELFASTRNDADRLVAIAERNRRHPGNLTVPRRVTRPHLGAYGQAQVAGYAAGEATNISHGVDGAPAVLQLESGR